jgi:hypothetical protein
MHEIPRAQLRSSPTAASTLAFVVATEKNLLSSHLSTPLLLRLEVVQQHISLLALLTPVPDNDAAAVDDLASIALTVQYAQASPLAEHLSVRHLDERDLVFGAQRDDQFLVGLLFATFIQDAHVGLSAVEGFGCFTQAAGETVVDECEAKDTWSEVRLAHVVDVW